jgi:hypothetical protein
VIPRVRVLGVPNDVLRAREVGEIEGMVEEADAKPELARMLQNGISFRFPDNEDEERMWINPHICAWGRQLHDRIPHFLYYQYADSNGMALSLVRSSFVPFGQIPVTPDDDQAAAEVKDLLLPIYADRLVAVASFAEEVADDWRVIVGRFIDQMDHELGQAVSNTIEASLALSGS